TSRRSRHAWRRRRLPAGPTSRRRSVKRCAPRSPQPTPAESRCSDSRGRPRVRETAPRRCRRCPTGLPSECWMAWRNTGKAVASATARPRDPRPSPPVDDRGHSTRGSDGFAGLRRRRLRLLATTIFDLARRLARRRSGRLRPLSEQGAADADVRRAEADRDLEVGAHAHAQHLEVVTLCDLAQQGEMRRRLLVLGRDAHEADDGKPVLAATGLDEGVGLGRQHARLLRLGTGIHLDQAFGAPSRALHLVSQRLGEAGAVDRLDDVEELDRLPDLVRLQWADQVERQAFEPLAKRRPATRRLLDAVLAEYPLPGPQRRLDALFRLQLADRHQLDRRGIATGGTGRLGHPAADLIEIPGDVAL